MAKRGRPRKPREPGPKKRGEPRSTLLGTRAIGVGPLTGASRVELELRTWNHGPFYCFSQMGRRGEEWVSVRRFAVSFEELRAAYIVAAGWEKERKSAPAQAQKGEA